MSTYPRFILINKNSQSFRLSIPILPSFTPLLIPTGSRFSLTPPIPGQNLPYQLNNSSGRVLNFTVNINGEIGSADTGLLIITIPNGLLTENNEKIKVGYDQIKNNGLIILS